MVSLAFSLFLEYLKIFEGFFFFFWPQGLCTHCSLFLEGSSIHSFNGGLLNLWFSAQMALSGGVICHVYALPSAYTQEPCPKVKDFFCGCDIDISLWSTL